MIVPKISVIVPIYKAQKHIHRCIDSILAQTYQDFEVLLIDDGSPDNSGAICDDYARKDSRIKVFHKKNEGVTQARKIGVENSIGEWVFFIDSDDIIAKNALEVLYKYAIDKNSDIVIGDYQCVDDNLTPLSVFHNRIASKDNKNVDVLEAVLNGDCSGILWGRIIKKELLDNIYYPPRYINIGEDVICGIQLLSKAKNVIICPYILYNYVQQNTSVMHTLCADTVKYMPLFIEWIHSFVSINYPAIIQSSSAYCMKQYFLYIMNGGNFSNEMFLSFYDKNVKMPNRVLILFSLYKANSVLGNLYRSVYISLKTIGNILTKK